MATRWPRSTTPVAASAAAAVGPAEVLQMMPPYPTLTLDVGRDAPKVARWVKRLDALCGEYGVDPLAVTLPDAPFNPYGEEEEE